eukprot:1446815-Rhodomonas_salina.2
MRLEGEQRTCAEDGELARGPRNRRAALRLAPGVELVAAWRVDIGATRAAPTQPLKRRHSLARRTRNATQRSARQGSTTEQASSDKRRRAGQRHTAGRLGTWCTTTRAGGTSPSRCRT